MIHERVLHRWDKVELVQTLFLAVQSHPKLGLGLLWHGVYCGMH